MTDLQSLLLTPRGRIGRQSYWTLVVAMVVVGLVLSLMPFFGPLVSLALLWPFGCIVAKRLHDAGRRAWMVPVVAGLSLVAGILSFVAMLMATNPASLAAAIGLAAPALLLSGIGSLATVALILVAGLVPGTEGGNRFGDPEAHPFTLATLLATGRA